MTEHEAHESRSTNKYLMKIDISTSRCTDKFNDDIDGFRVPVGHRHIDVVDW